MANNVDPVYFEELLKQDPVEISRNSLCIYEEKNERYIINFLNEDYFVEPKKGRIYSLKEKDKSPGILAELTIIYYLLYSKDERIRGEWISEKDIPGGSMFFNGPHAIPTDIIDKRLLNITDFNSRCETLCARRVEMGDSAYSIRVLPRIPVAVLYWKGDQDYPPQTRLLFDRTISSHLSLDVIFGMTVELCRKLSG